MATEFAFATYALRAPPSLDRRIALIRHRTGGSRCGELEQTLLAVGHRGA